MQPFIRQLRTNAAHLWRVGIAELDCDMSRTATHARIAVCHVAYHAGADYDDVALAFGWSRYRTRDCYGRARVVVRHAGLLVVPEYVERYSSLAFLAHAHTCDPLAALDRARAA